MSKALIVGWEDARASGGALQLGGLLAPPFEATLLVAHVFAAGGPLARAGAGGEAARRERAQQLLHEAEELVESEPGLATLALPSRSAAQGLNDLAEERSARCVVVGSSRRGAVGRILAGDTAAGLLHGAPCPVAVAPRDYRAPTGGLKAIGVAFDGRAGAELALSAAAEVASRSGARLHLMAVAEPPGPGGMEAIVGVTLERIMEETRRELGDALELALGSLAGSLQADSELLEGHAADELTRAAGDLDLLVTGSRGYGPLGRVLLGSTSARLAHDASCPLLAIPGRRQRPPA